MGDRTSTATPRRLSARSATDGSFAATLALLVMLLGSVGCASYYEDEEPPRFDAFRDDLDLLERYGNPIILYGKGGARVVVMPEWQGRVMTSTAGERRRPGYGWVHRALIAYGEIRPNMQPWGGEDRFWIGPEGGRFSVFFAPDAPFELEQWQAPLAVDAEPWDVTSVDDVHVELEHETSLLNRAGFRFEIGIDREVRLLDPSEVEESLGFELPRCRLVAYESTNTITNRGTEAWTEETGTPSIWILGMFPATPRTTVVLPLRSEAREISTGFGVRDDYFGEVPANRLILRDDCVFFRADGNLRSKIGVGPDLATSRIAAWSPENQQLTLITFDLPEGAEHYVTSWWSDAADPFAGAVVRSYSDGPREPDQPIRGAFHEIETSSPAAALAPEEWITHRRRTHHFRGRRKALDAIALEAIGIGLDEIESALPGQRFPPTPPTEDGPEAEDPSAPDPGAETEAEGPADAMSSPVRETDGGSDAVAPPDGDPSPAADEPRETSGSAPESAVTPTP
jgi:hypothetical protein